MSGWIKLYRSLMDDPVWNIKPFSKGQAWIDLLMLANYTDKTRVIDGEVRVFRRGTVCISQRDLAERWGWSRGRVSRFLRYLECDGKCAVTSASYGTVITIENYELYAGE